MDAGSLAVALASALAGAYFLATFAFVAYALTKYNDLKDDLRTLQNRLDLQADWQSLVKAQGESALDERAKGQGGPHA